MARYVTTKPTVWDADTAFAWMADLRHLAVWDPSITGSAQVVGDGPGVGAEYDVTLEIAGRETTMRYRIAECDPGARTLLAESETSVLTSSDRISVATDGGRVTVTYDADLVLKGPAKIGDPVLGIGFDRMGDKAAAGLEETLALPVPPP
jgi:hypothetical protein